MTPKAQRRIEVFQKALRDVKDANALLANMKTLMEANSQIMEILGVTETQICKFVDVVLDVAEELGEVGDGDRGERLQRAAQEMLDQIQAELIPPGRLQ